MYETHLHPPLVMGNPPSMARSAKEWAVTPDQERRARNAIISGLSISACLWLVIGGIVWSAISG